ncbi:putative repeat protein (TIGR02543 family), partial [Bacilli bacterium PM5-9]|nr:putative repeat protein (TIGR02543 family) [Bacilli bacterium PM5-9]
NLSKTGYDFAGWNTRADGTGTTYVAGTGTFKITANTTLYAKWKKTTASYKVIHNIQDNENKYKAIETETYTGLVGKSPELKPKEISGYTYKNKKTTYKSSSEKSGLIKIPILVDDSLVINLYYDLNIVIKIGPVKPSISNNDISFDNKNNIKEKIKKSDNGKTKINNFLYEKMYKNIETEDSDKYYIYINSVILSVFAFLIFLVPFLVIAYIIKKIENSYDSLSEL